MQTVLRADRVIDGLGHVIEKGAVLYAGDRILDVGPAATIGVPEGAVVRDVAGTVMPGLCDVHVHLAYDGRPSEGGMHRFDFVRFSHAEIALRAARFALDTLRAGFTTVRDLAAPAGTIIDLRNAINRGDVVGPRIKACGMGLTATGGHMDPPGWADHVEMANMTAPCDGPVAFRKGVREQLKRGADFIKLNTWVSYHDSPDRFWRQEMTEEEIAAACDEAHAQGVHVAAHTYGPPGVASSVRNGVDCIEHGHWIDDATIELMVRNGTTLVPTLTVNDVHAGMALKNPDLAEKYKRWHRRSSEDKWDTLARVRKAGIRVCTGTDCGFQIAHGQWNAYELVLMVRGGYTPMEAIVAATANSADLLGLDVGRLVAGKYADILIVDGFPLDVIAVLGQRDRLSVIKGGVAVN